MVLLIAWSFSFAIYVGATSVSMELHHAPIALAGSIPLFLLGTILILFANTSMGIFMGTIARTMPQFGLIFIMTILPIMILSGAVTPFESMPLILQNLMHFFPTSHFVSMSQAILYRGAGFDIIWIDMFWILLIGIIFFLFSLSMFKKSLH